MVDRVNIPTISSAAATASSRGTSAKYTVACSRVNAFM